jgi:hypothetical protein
MTWMQTYNGTPFELTAPKKEDVDFEEIAHSLSQICRFAGHVRPFYSVAEHCCRVADLLPHPLKAYGLLHDAHESYIGDITTPVKRCFDTHQMRAFNVAVEQPIMRAIYEAAFIDPDPDPSILEAVKFADMTLMMTERRDLFRYQKPERDWGEYEAIEPLADRIVPWTMSFARDEFRRRLRGYLAFF